MTAHEKLVLVRELLCEIRDQKPEIGTGLSNTVIHCDINTIRAIANQILYAYKPEAFGPNEKPED